MHRTLIVTLTGLIGLTIGLTGCELSNIGTDCTGEARASVQVTLVDETDGAITGAAVNFRSTDLVGQPCQEFTSGEYVCGYEVSGTIEIDMQADGYESAQRTVVVSEDECHVITEMVTVTLTAIP